MLKILIIDDDAVDREAIVRAVERIQEGVVFHEATTGHKALECLDQEEFDTIILDYLLPDINGLEILKKLCAGPGIFSTPVIMLTGEGNEEVAVEAMKLGAVDYILKDNLTPASLKRAVNNAIMRSVLRKQDTALAELTQKKALLSDSLSREVETKNRFFSIIAHDLKSPFTTLLGMTQLMALEGTKWDKSQFIEYAGHINHSAERVFELLESLLEWSRLQMSDGKVEQVQFDVSDLVDNVVNLEFHSALEKHISIESSIKSMLVYADEQMVQTVLRNLLTNAIKFTDPQGKIIISATETDNMIELCVQDTGVGFKAQQLRDVFRMDVKVSTKGTAGEVGTGLGLPLCKELIEMNGGRIWIENHKPQGTSVKFTLLSSKPV